MKSECVSGRGAFPTSVNVCPSSRSISAAIASASSCDSTRFALVLGREPAHADAVRCLALQRLVDRPQTPLVERVGDEAADLGPHPSRLLEEQAELGLDRLGLPQDVVERARVGALRVDALRHLRELERVSEENDAAGCRAAGERVGEGELARLVDEQRVERSVHLLARVHPRRSGDEERVRVVVAALLHVSGLLERVVAALDAAEVEAFLRSGALDLVDERADDLVALRDDPDPASLPDQVRDQSGAAVGLAGAGRALDDEVGALEPVEERALVVELEPLERLAAERRLAPQQPLEVRVAAVAREDRAREPAEGGALPRRRERRARERSTSAGARRRTCRRGGA